MREVIKEYGSTFLAVVTAVLLIAVFMYDIRLIGNTAYEYGGSGRTDMAAGEWLSVSVKTSMDRKTGDVSAKEPAVCDRTYTLNELYSYTDGEIEDARIISVKREDGFDITERVCPDGKHLTFFEEGVVKVCACIWNREGVRSIRRIYLGVVA